MKIAVLGYSGSGKSTLAEYLGRLYAVPVLHLDRVQFLPGWRVRDRGEALKIVSGFMEAPSWVIDGNYSRFLQEERLRRADRIVILEFSRLSCLFRVWKRFRKYRGAVRESMAEGCPEKLDAEFLRWVVFGGRTRKKREEYRRIAAQYRGRTTVLKNQRQLEQYMREAAASPGSLP